MDTTSAFVGSAIIKHSSAPTAGPDSPASQSALPRHPATPPAAPSASPAPSARAGRGCSTPPRRPPSFATVSIIMSARSIMKPRTCVAGLAVASRAQATAGPAGAWGLARPRDGEGVGAGLTAAGPAGLRAVVLPFVFPADTLSASFSFYQAYTRLIGASIAGPHSRSLPSRVI